MTGQRYEMPAKPGSHQVYIRDGDLVVDWYDFGDHAPYESGNFLIFEPVARAALAAAMELPADTVPEAHAAFVAGRFDSYFEVRAFADERKLAYRHEVDFWP